MTLKEILEQIWNNREIINPCHINIWSITKRGICFANKVWCSRGRKASFK